jgi:hypothetical protein
MSTMSNLNTDTSSNLPAVDGKIKIRSPSEILPGYIVIGTFTLPNSTQATKRPFLALKIIQGHVISL